MSPTLAKQGRLRGDICNPDYEFLDPRLYAFVSVSTNCSISRLDTRAAGSFSTTEVCVDGTGRHCAAIPSILTSPITNPCCGELPKRAMKFYLRWLKTLFIHSLKIVPRYSKHALQEQCRSFVAELLQERGAFVFQRQRFFLQELGEGASVSQLICSAPGVVAAKSHFTYLGCSPLLQGS
jgi:anaerobic magnesium-protoporphyrin IX monomethyl ester cyclase